jgi:hypothetical protein
MKKTSRILPSERQTYHPPTLTRIKLQDQRVVSMSVCKDSLGNTACAQDGVTLLYTLNPS